MGVSQQAERAQRVALPQPPAQPQQLDLLGDGAVTAAVAQKAGSDPASYPIFFSQSWVFHYKTS